MTVSWDGTTPRRALGKVRRGKLSHSPQPNEDSLIPKTSLVERRQRRQEEEPPQQEPLSNPQPQDPQDTNGAPNPYTSFSNPNSPNTNTNVSPATLQNVLLTPPILPTTNTVGGNPDPSTPATTTITTTTTTVVGDPVQVHEAPNAPYGTGSSHVIPVVSVSSSALSGGPANSGGEWEAFHSPPLPPPTTTTTTIAGTGTGTTGTIPPGQGGGEGGGGPVPVQSASIPPPPLDGPSSSTTTTGTVLPESGLDGGGPVPSSVPDSSSSLLGVPAPTRAPSVPWGDNGGGGGPSLAVGAPTPVYSQQPLTSQPPYVIANAGGPPHTDPTNHTKKIPPSTKSSRCTNWSKSMQLPCHVGYSLWEHPVSWLVVLLSLYGLYAIRQQRHRRALTAVRGEYRQVAARDADRAFDDEDEPDDDEYYNDDNDDNDNDAWMVNGSIQMKSLGQEGLSLEETNG